MGLNAFDHLVNALTKFEQLKAPTINVPTNPQKIKISIEEYELFLKELVFEKLRGKSLSEAFIERFDVKDIVLNIQLTDSSADDYIRKFYIE